MARAEAIARWEEEAPFYPEVGEIAGVQLSRKKSRRWILLTYGKTMGNDETQRTMGLCVPFTVFLWP